jgi:RNA polymerase sigma factor (sigma-70 family)
MNSLINKSQIYIEEYNKLFAYAMTHTCRINAQDVLQKVFIYLNNKKEESFTDANHVIAWLIWMVKHECYAINKKENKYIQVEQEEFDLKISEEKDPSEIACDEDLKSKILEKISEKLKLLPRLQRNCLEFYYLKGKNRHEISKIEKTTANAVSVAINKGTKTIKNLLKNNF